MKRTATPFPIAMSSLTQWAREAEDGQENRSPLTSENSSSPVGGPALAAAVADAEADESHEDSSWPMVR